MLRRVLAVLLVLVVAVVVIDRARRPIAGLAGRVAESRHPDVVTAALPEGEWAEVRGLGGPWDFRLGDDPAWRAGGPAEGWEPIPVPSAWEDAGFWGYDGMAWYRRTFTLTPDEAARLAAAPAFLYLGRVDDADEAWVNGALVGASGRMPDATVSGAPTETAYYRPRFYRIPPGLLRADGPNTVTVRVWDAQMAGGMLDGTPGLYVATAPSPAAPPWVADLAGRWRFRPGDDPAWADPGFDDAGWDEITVPARWEQQGYPDYDGYAWYRTRFVVKDPDDGPFVLLLGRIDDLDEVWLDGRRIGGTGNLASRSIGGDEWQHRRVYSIPEHLLRARTTHTLAVRVYDAMFDGGIYEGPVGVLRQEDYERLAGG